MMDQIALALGLALVPGLLLKLGHGYNRNSPRERRLFWGGVFGYFTGALVFIAFVLIPVVWWGEERNSRSTIVHWMPLLLGLAGLLLARLSGSADPEDDPGGGSDAAGASEPGIAEAR